MSGDTRVTIPSLARYLSRALVDFVYPPHCAACGTWLELAEDLLCPQCWRELETVGGRRCRRCGCPIGDVTKTVAPTHPKLMTQPARAHLTARPGIGKRCPHRRQRPPLLSGRAQTAGPGTPLWSECWSGVPLRG